MNDIQKFVNGVIKNHSMHKRYIAVLTALSMVVSIVVTSILVMPADSKAGSLICDKTEHIHNESCKKLVCGLDEVIYDEITTEAVSQAIGQVVQLAQPEGEVVGAVEMVETEGAVEAIESSEVVEDTESIAEVTEETVVSDSAQEITEEISEVTESVQHIHTDECYMYVCGFEEHTHSEDCYESVEVDPTPDEVDSYMINQNAFDVFNVFGRPMHLLYNDVSTTGEYSNESGLDSTMEVNPGAILGVATHFHVLAEEASFQSHVHGNVATNHLIQCGAFGVYLNKLAGKSSVNYIRNFAEYAPLDNAYQTKLVLGAGYSYQLEANRYKITAPDERVYYIPVSNFPEGDEYEPHIVIDDSYINVTKELDKFADMSRAIAAKPSKDTVVNGDINSITDKVLITDNGGEQYVLDFSKITDKYIYYTLDMTGKDKNGQPLINFSTCSKVLEIKGITEDKFLFLTVDVGDNENVAFNKSWRVYRADDQSQVYGTGEVPLDDGSCRVIYNIVNSTTDTNGNKVYTPFGENSEGQPTDSKIILGEQKNGTFLVPRGYVNCAGNTNGTIIAYKYVATGESHRADIQFEDEEVDDVDCPTTSENITSSGGNNTQQQNISITVNKVWNDGNENHTDGVTVRLYKAYESNLDINDNSLIGNKLWLVDDKHITLNKDNGWSGSFTDLPVKEGENLIYYYIKEDVVTGYTATYSANALNTVDRTVTVRNVKLMNLVIKKQWHKSDGTLITASDVDDNNNNILASMPSVQCTLYKSNIHLANNLPTEAEVVETFNIGANEWQYTKAQLPTEEAGKPLYYYVIETPVDGYNVSYENVGYLGSESITVKNTQKASGTISLIVYKNWLATDVSGVIDYTSPVKAANIEVTVELQKSTDGVNWSYADKATFTTSYTFTNLPKQENGTDIYYRVKELNVPYGYQDLYSKTSVKAQDVTDNGEATITVTNTLIKNSLTIKKNWHNDDSRGVSSIIVEVYRKLAGANNNPPISGTGESVPEDDPITPPSQGEPEVGDGVQGETNADGNLVFPPQEVTQENNKICYDLLPFKGRMVKSVTIYSKPSEGSNELNYNGVVSIGTYNRNYTGGESNSDKGQVISFENENLIVGKEISEGITITCLDINSNSNFSHIITGIEVEFYDGWYDISTGQKLSSFIRNNWLLFDSVSSDSVSYDANTNVLTVIPNDGSFASGIIDGQAWRYIIPSNYYTYNISKVRITCDEGAPSYSGVILISGSNENGVIWDQEKIEGGSYNNNVIEYSGLDYSMDKHGEYSVYLRNYCEAKKVQKLEITFATNSTPQYTQGNTTHNFTTNGTSSSFYTISGELSTNKDTQYYNGLTLTQCLKINSKASISFSVSENHTGKLILVFGNSKGESFYIDNTLYTVDDDGVLEIDNLSVGSHTIRQNSGNEPDLFYMTYSETVVENEKKDEVSFVNNVLTVIPANAKGENNKYYQNNEHHFENAWGYQIPSEYRGKTITNIKITFGSSVNGAEVWILTNKDQGVMQAFWEGSTHTSSNGNSSSSFEWSNISYTIPTTYPNYSLYVIEVGDINSNGNNSSNLQDYTITELKITFASQEEPKDTYVKGNEIHNFTINGTLNEFYTINGTVYKDKGSLWYNNGVENVEYKYCLGIDGSSSISFTNTKTGTLMLVGNYANTNINIDGKSYYINNTVSVTLEAGNHTISKSGDGVYLYYMSYSDNQSSTKLNESKTYPFEVTDNGNGPHYNNSQVLYRGTEFKNYLDKTFTKFEVYYKDSSSVDYADWFGIHEVSTSWDNSESWDRFEPIENPTYNNNIVTYNYGEIAVVNFYENDFFRIKVNNPAVVEKIVFYFKDESIYTLYNDAYGKEVEDDTQNNVLVLPVDKFIEEGVTNHDQNQYAWTYYLKEYKGKTIKSIKANFDGITSGSQYNGLIILNDGSNNVFQQNYSSQQGEITMNCGNGYVVNDSENYKLVVTRRISNEYKLISVEITFAESISNQEPTEPEEPKQVHLERDITINFHGYGSELKDYGYWNDNNHDGFGFENTSHGDSYIDKIFTSIDIYYRDMLTGFPDWATDTKIFVQYNSWNCPEDTTRSFNDNVATWYFDDISGSMLVAKDSFEKFFNLKTSRPDEISKVVICFTDGSTYTMNNTAYVASSKVESSEDDYTYNTGEYVLIAKITLTADRGWSEVLTNLPATDGQGNAYTYHIKETNMYGSDADKFKILSYTHEDGIVLENDSNNIGVTNARNDDESIIVLPNTGSTGAKGYFIAGIIVMICSAAGYTVIKRRLIC